MIEYVHCLFVIWANFSGGVVATANIRMGFVDGLFEYPSAPGYSWMLEAMLSDPLLVRESLHNYAKRPEFTVACKWLTENGEFPS